MTNIESIVRQINREFVPHFEEKLRTYLEKQDKDWLIEQIVRLTMDAQSLQEMDRKHSQEVETQKRKERTKRIIDMKLNESKLKIFVNTHMKNSREDLMQSGALKPGTPPKGGEMITNEFRSKKGNDLLQHAKDMLFALLFGDHDLKVSLNRTQRKLLTLTVPRMKSISLNFMKATTELSALGTWQDPNGMTSDARADNSIMEIEYGETRSEMVGKGIVSALRLINNLEINEEILYGRMGNIEQSTLAL